MEDRPQKSKRIQGKNEPKKHSIPVQSRYLNFTKKGSSQCDSLESKSVLEATMQCSSAGLTKLRAVANSTQIGNGNKFSAVSAGSSCLVPEQGKVVKSSTPVKDGTFACDLSVVSVGTECEIRKKPKQEDPAELEEEILLQDNMALCLEALTFLVKRQQSTSAHHMDMQLAAMQKAVDDSKSTLSTLDLKLHAATSLAELREDLTVCEDAIGELSDGVSISDSKCFKDLTSQIENVLNQLRCKNVQIPRSQKDLDEIRRAATRLSSALSTFLQDHKEEMGRVSRVKKDMVRIQAFCDTLVNANSSMKELMPMATAKVMDELSRALMNSAYVNKDIEF